MLLQNRFVLVNLAANVAFVLCGSGIVRFQFLLDQCGWVVVIQTIVLLQTVHVIESRTTSIALLKLHEVVHGRVSRQRILVHEVLAADFAREFHRSMVSFRVPFHIGGIHPHETAPITGYSFRGVRLFHVSVQHELLGIRLFTSGTLEGPMNTVDDPQMCH